jgi:hypothetical protein
MTFDELNELLQAGIVRVSFIKKTDGSERVMLATRHKKMMPPPPAPDPTKKPGRPMPEGHILVWDTEANALRSFDTAALNKEPELVEPLDGQ